MPAPVPTAAPQADFERLAPGRFRATEHTGGAWSATEQHISPLNGLLVHAIDRFVAQRAAGGSAAPDVLRTARVSFDILGVVPIDEVDVSVEVVRPGRTVELLEAVAASGGRPVLRARAWRLARHDTGVVAGGSGRLGRCGPVAHAPSPSVIPNSVISQRRRARQRRSETTNPRPSPSAGRTPGARRTGGG